jgi:hypothetical protein
VRNAEVTELSDATTFNLEIITLMNAIPAFIPPISQQSANTAQKAARIIKNSERTEGLAAKIRTNISSRRTIDGLIKIQHLASLPHETPILFKDYSGRFDFRFVERICSGT